VKCLSAATSVLNGGLGIGLGQVLDFALLAVLCVRQLAAGSPLQIACVCFRHSYDRESLAKVLRVIRRGESVKTSGNGCTYGPLGEAKVLLTPALSLEPLLLLQAAAHGASGDGEVAVVAVGSASS
jgi:hypothetical protein